MQKKQGTGNINALEIPDALAQYNNENNVVRARLLFSFVGTTSTDENDITTQLLGRIGNNTYSVIIDISDIGIQKAVALFVGKQAQFTVYTFTIDELTGGKWKVVNNGEREYSSLSSPHIGDFDDKTALDSLTKRLIKDVESGKLLLGEMPKNQQPPQQGGQWGGQMPPQGGQMPPQGGQMPPQGGYPY